MLLPEEDNGPEATASQPLKKYQEIAEKRTLRIAIGTARIGADKTAEGKMVPVYGHEAEEVEILRHCFELGLNHIDTARIYGDGHTEEIIGQAIAGLDRERFVIASKVGQKPTTREQVVRDVEEILRRLGIRYLDVVYVHDRWEGKMGEEMDQCLAGLDDVVDAGLARAIGISNFRLEELQRAVRVARHPIAIYQARYNVLSRPLVTPELLKFCQENGIVVAAHTALGRGTLGEGWKDEQVMKMAAKYGKTPTQIALNWLLSQENVVAVVRAHSKEHIAQNLAAFDFRLEAGDIERLDKLVPQGTMQAG